MSFVISPRLFIEEQLPVVVFNVLHLACSINIWCCYLGLSYEKNKKYKTVKSADCHVE